MDSDIVQISDIFGTDTQELEFEKNFEMIDISDEKVEEINDEETIQKVIPSKIKNYDKLIEKIQIGLIIFLIISATLIYFFGYDFLEPFIKID